MRIQRLRISAFPPLPSESRSLWRMGNDQHINQTSRYLTYTEVIFCGLLGVATGLMFRSQDYITALMTTLIGSTLPTTLLLFDMFASRQVLATKTFFTDFPVHGVASLDDDLFAISGGGGGLSYGIPDQCAIVALQHQDNRTLRPPGALAFHVINNSDGDAFGREELRKLDLAVLQSLTPHSFWGLAASSGLLCGGVAGVIHVFRVASAKEARSRAPYVLFGDSVGRCLIPIGSHTLVEQSFSRKKKVFIRRSVVQGNKIAVVTEDERLAYYIVISDFLSLVAVASFPQTKILAVHFDTSGENLLVLTADHRLLQFAAPTVPSEVVEIMEGKQPKSMGCRPGLAELHFVRDDSAPRRILRNSAALTWAPISQIKFRESLTITPRHLVIVQNPGNPDRQDSQQQDTIILVGTVEAPSSIKTAHASIASSLLSRSCGEPSLRMVESWRYKVLKNIGGCPAVAISDQYLTVVGNQKFVVLDKHTLAIKQAYDRHDQDTPVNNTLPVTAADISKNEKYLLVGTADYSVVVAPLDCTAPRWLAAASTSSGKVLDYLKAVMKVASLTVMLAFFMT